MQFELVHAQVYYVFVGMDDDCGGGWNIYKAYIFPFFGVGSVMLFDVKTWAIFVNNSIRSLQKKRRDSGTLMKKIKLKEMTLEKNSK